MTDANLMERPNRDDYQPVEKAKTIDDALKNKAMVARFHQAAPRHLNADRMLRVCALAVYKNPDLAKCEVMSLLGAMLQLASLGLEPNTQLGHAYLIPFKSRRKGQNGWEDYFQVQVIIGYRGLIDLARRTGMLVSIHADVVYGPINTPGHDVFDFEYGSLAHLKHIPSGNRDMPLFAYAHAKLKDGEAFEVRPYNLILDIRNKSQGYRAALNAKTEAGNDPSKAYMLKTWEASPWVAYEHEMAAKTMIRAISKSLPMSIEFARAVEIDEMGETQVIDFAAMARAPEALEYTPTVPFEPPVERREPETITQPPPQAAAPKPRQQRPRPPADAVPVSPPPPPPPPPEPVRVEPEPALEEAALAPTAFELVTGDGQILEWSDWADFREAYRTELANAFQDHGLAGGDGFYESNRRVFLEWAQSNVKQATELEQIYAGLRANFAETRDERPEPPPSDAGRGLF